MSIINESISSFLVDRRVFHDTENGDISQNFEVENGKKGFIMIGKKIKKIFKKMN